MHDDKTTRGYPLPHSENELQVDVSRLRAAITAIDGEVDDALRGIDTLSDDIDGAKSDIESMKSDIYALKQATPDEATMVSPGTVKLATNAEVETASGDGVITARQGGMIKPAEATTETAGIVKLAEVPME